MTSESTHSSPTKTSWRRIAFWTVVSIACVGATVLCTWIAKDNGSEPPTRRYVRIKASPLFPQHLDEHNKKLLEWPKVRKTAFRSEIGINSRCGNDVTFT